MKKLIIRHDNTETLEAYLRTLEKATRFYYNVYGLRRIDSHKNESGRQNEHLPRVGS